MTQRTVRRFDDLRGKPDKPEADAGSEPIERAIKRCLATPDGERLLYWLISEAGAVTPVNCPESVLREAEGVRRLVAKLRSLIAA